MSPADKQNISVEERNGDLFVFIIDKYGDGHVHQLDLGTTTKPQALKILAEKQNELRTHP